MAQRQVVSPVLTAASLQRQEEHRIALAREPLQRRAASLGAGLPSGALNDALQRQMAAQAPLPARPQSAADWVTVMRHRAEQVDGQRLSSKQAGEFTALQRQVASVLAQSARQIPPAAFAQHAVSLQRHPLSAPVARTALSLLPPLQRLSLQRAVDEAAALTAVQRVQDAHAFELQGVQRQLAELDTQVTQPVLQRIQARRGGGNPLPVSVQRHLEQGLNHDLSGVRVHDDAEAHTLAKGVNAVAFTTGRDIFFQSGRFNPNTQSGLELLAHEVTHTVQQAQGRVGQGIDPDAGLEAEARSMGAKLARRPVGPAFGTRVRRPGGKTTPPPSLQRLRALPETTIQRWGLGDLKKLAGSVKTGLTNKVKGVGQAAREAVASITKKVRAAAAPALQKAKAAARQARALASRTLMAAKKKIQAAPRALREHASKKLRALSQKVAKAGRALQQKTRDVGQQALRLRRQAGQAIHNTVKNVGHRAKLLAQKARQAAPGLLASAKAKFTQTVTKLKSSAAAQLTKARDGAKQLLERARTGATQVKEKAVTFARQVKADLSAAAQTARKAAATGWKSAVGLAKGARSQVLSGIQAVQNNPRVQQATKFIKKAGVQILKVGTAIVVGGAVIAGAAALTAATGGLAGPALVVALFASGALGGAAATVVENVLKKNKDGWLADITFKSLLVDGTLGVALGPLSKVAGGVVRAVAKPILSGTGRVIGAAATRYTPTQAAQIVHAAGLAKTGAAHMAGSVKAAGSAVAGTARAQWNTFRTMTGPALSAARTAVGTRVRSSLVGRAVRGLDRGASGMVRGLSRRSQALQDKLQGLRAVRGPRTPSRTPLARKVQSLKDQAALKALRARNAGQAGWEELQRRTMLSEIGFRTKLSHAGMSVDVTKSLTGRAFAATERSLSQMRSYISAESRTIATEVREQWRGSAGIGGYLRAGQNMETLVGRVPSLQPVWKQEMVRARSVLVKAQARRLRLEAQAAGGTLSRRASERQARALVTADDTYRQAVGNVSGQFMVAASRAYRAQSQTAVTGFDLNRNLLGQVPGAYGLGVKQMWGGITGRAASLKAAGGFSGAAALAGGWVGEEFFKTVVGGAASSYKSDKNAKLPNRRHLEAGLADLKKNAVKNSVTGMSGLIPEVMGGRLMFLAPGDQLVKSRQQIMGLQGTTVSNELQTPPDQDSAGTAGGDP